MKQIELRKLSLLNFKGIARLDADFGKPINKVLGRNGSGKTTLFDAFTWVLFGKDSKDRKAFDIKTIGEDGKPIARLPHEVTAVISVDGEEITLCRRYSEKWSKKRGLSGEVFTGHEEERLYNDVPLSVKEWNAKIEAICPEQVFKMITSPSYFASQKPEVQRAMLFRMAGDISDADVARGNKSFEALLANLTGKTLEEYKREIGAQKKRIKSEIEAIPERIDERQRDIAELSAPDFAAVEAEAKHIEAELADLEKRRDDAREAVRAHSERLAELQRKASDLQMERARRESEIQRHLFEAHSTDMENYRKMMSEAEHYDRVSKQCAADIDKVNERIESRKKILEDLRDKYRKVKAGQFEFDPNEAVCPTCKRRLEAEDIEARQAELEENFNADKSRKLIGIAEKAEEVKKELRQLLTELDGLHSKAEAAVTKLYQMKGNADFGKEPAEPDYKEAITQDEKWQQLCEQVAAAEDAVREAAPEAVNTDELRSRIEALSYSLSERKITLAYKDIIEHNKTRIIELETAYKNGCAEIAKLEAEEDTMDGFRARKVAMIEARVSSLFSFVRFKMYDYLIDGTPVETCEAVVDGVPYSSQNNAMRINMGLDIINAICRSEDVCAPIFLDNAESCLTLCGTEAQQVRLIVSDTDLTIE